jgi:hypothetical protein
LFPRTAERKAGTRPLSVCRWQSCSGSSGESFDFKPLRGEATGIAGIDARRPVLPRLVLVGGDRFHQGDELALDRLILDLAVGAQQPEAECAVQK